MTIEPLNERGETMETIEDKQIEFLMIIKYNPSQQRK
jgi:hypothetical protein